MMILVYTLWLTTIAMTVPTAPAMRKAPHEEPMMLETPTGTISGMLTVPDGSGPYPVALIIAGSGPTDRDGNSPAGVRTDMYKLLAERLAGRGVATVRYDKRGIAASKAAATSESALRFETYIDDATAWVRKLRTDKRFSSVTIIGHSEGSLIGMVAARTAPADAYVSLEGAGSPAADILRTQLKGKLPPDLAAASDRILADLEQGHTTDSVPASLVSLYRTSVQPYMISWFRYDPAREIAKLTIPVLIVQGTHDIQVSLDDANKLALGDTAATLVVIDGMTHVLKDAPAGQAAQTAAYTDPSLPLDAKVVPTIADFILRKG